MSGNTIGKLFTVTSYGESHGPALDVWWMAALQEWSYVNPICKGLDRRKPGQSRLPLREGKMTK